MQKLVDYFLNGTENKSHKSIVRWMWRLFFAGISAVILVFVALSFSDLPSVKELENPKSEEASLLYGSNGQLIGRYYLENRIPVTYEQLDQDLINALIATEDERYHKHSGIDFRGLGRVFFKTVLMRDRSAGGASTITQQLAKQLFTVTPGSGMERVVQKLQEWIIAVRLERKYTKQEIIAMYLNKFDFLNQAYGIKAAAETYFSKPQDSLEVNEAALLVGMLKNPNLYNPLRFPENAKKRREVVLKQMLKNDLLTTDQYEGFRKEPIEVGLYKNTHIDGIGTYVRMELVKDIKRILNEERKSDGTKYNIYKDGLKIFTTIDPEMQRLAEETKNEHMPSRQKQFNREWRKTDIWDPSWVSKEDIPVSVRQRGLTKLIRSTDRYQSLRKRYLTELIEKLQDQVPNLTFHRDDREIDRIIKESETPGHLDDLILSKMISGSLASAYRKVLKSPDFPELKAKWEELQTHSKALMNGPVKMKVFTYENSRMEKDTTMTPLDSIKYHRNFLQIGSLGVDPKTGAIKFWVGGINYKYFQYDHVRISRQVGSTFKPFVYATAIFELGMSPCHPVYDWPQTIRPGDGTFYLSKEWTPRNFNGKYSNERLTLFQGLQKSKNTVSVYLMKQLGSPEPVRNLVKNMGIDTESRYGNGQLRVPSVPSICLGAVDLSVEEMVGAYTTFANNGTMTKPYLIQRIEDKNGATIYEGKPQESGALPEKPNYVMVEMLRSSGNLTNFLESDVGGKTGTTNDYVDGWFIGITPTLVVGTWVGGEDQWIHMRYPSTGQGSWMAKPFFREFMKKLEKSEKVKYDKYARFFKPEGPLGIEIDCEQYQGDNIDVEGEFDDGESEEDVFGDEVKEDPFGTGNH